MKIILSPAKKIRKQVEFPPQGQPKFFAQTQEIYAALSAFEYNDVKKLWNCSDKIAQSAFQTLHERRPEEAYLPALLAYDGIAYQYMRPHVFSEAEWTYVQEHLRILSGFYGSLRPLDPIIPYRLEMQAPLQVGKHENLYSFWNHQLYDELYHENNLVINLASKEYSQCLRPYLKEKDQFIDLHFVLAKKGKLSIKATYAKMARGAMVRFMAERQIKTPEGLKEFQEFNYCYDAELSKKSELYFVKEE